MQNDHPGSPRGRAAAPTYYANLSLAATRHPPGGGAAFLTGHWDSHCELDFARKWGSVRVSFFSRLNILSTAKILKGPLVDGVRVSEEAGG